MVFRKKPGFEQVKKSTTPSAKKMIETIMATTASSGKYSKLAMPTRSAIMAIVISQALRS